MNRNIKEIVAQMTLEEKAGMCSGKDFWFLKSAERLGIPYDIIGDAKEPRVALDAIREAAELARTI